MALTYNKIDNDNVVILDTVSRVVNKLEVQQKRNYLVERIEELDKILELFI